jgi:hypothetical protein
MTGDCDGKATEPFCSPLRSELPCARAPLADLIKVSAEVGSGSNLAEK